MTRTRTLKMAQALFHYLPKPVRLGLMLICIAFGWEESL